MSVHHEFKMTSAAVCLQSKSSHIGTFKSRVHSSFFSIEDIVDRAQSVRNLLQIDRKEREEKISEIHDHIPTILEKHPGRNQRREREMSARVWRSRIGSRSQRPHRQSQKVKVRGMQSCKDHHRGQQRCNNQSI